MKVKVLGVQHKSGAFTANDGRNVNYDNMNLHCVVQNPDVSGHAVDVIKVKRPVWAAALAAVSMLSDTDALGATMNIDYDNRGRVVGVEVVSAAADE